MRLKSIKLAGFKSFVDPTTVYFPGNLNAVVGPNGCGKSNIIDAVRWVMGESSAKHLRGESMTDVIFSGSNGRNPVGQATIELVFDNSDATLQGEYGQYNEIAVRRTVTRDLQSIYYLNGSRCRRRDVQDVFLGTGLGPRSYSIIEQGMISRFVEAKPEDLRIYIEEAAGISKYKERRRETENRIRHTRENLDRLNDIREELDKQLQHLQRQAKAAERYAEYKAEERELKAQLLALKWQGLDQGFQLQENRIRELTVDQEARQAELRKIEADSEIQRQQHHKASEHYQLSQQSLYQINADISRQEQAIEHQKQRQQQLNDDLQQARENRIRAQAELDHDLKQQTQLLAETEKLTPELKSVEAVAATSREQLRAADQQMQQWQSQWDSFNQQAAEPRKQAEVAQSRIQALEENGQRLQRRIESLEKELAGIERPDDQRLNDLEQKIAGLEQNAAHDKGLLAECQATIDQQRQAGREVAASLDEVRRTLQECRGRYASLNALQLDALGKQDGQVLEWLESAELGKNARLAQRIKVEKGWEEVVELVLGHYLQAVCVEGFEDLVSRLDQLQAGELTFWSPAQAPAVRRESPRLLDKITGDCDLESLIGGIYLARDLDDALTRRSSLNFQESFICQEGVWVGRDWLRVRRSNDEQASLLVREQQLVDLRGEGEALAKRSSELEASQVAGLEALKAAEQARDSVQQRLSQQIRSQGELSSQLSALKSRSEQILVRQKRLQQDITDSKEQRELEAGKLQQVRLEWRKALDQVELDSSRREELLTLRDQLRKALDEARHQSNRDREKVHQLALQNQSVTSRLETLDRGISRLRDQVDRSAERFETLETALKETGEPIPSMQQTLQQSLDEKLTRENTLSSARRSMESIETELNQLDQSRIKAEGAVDAVRGQLEQSRLEAQTLKVQRQTLLDQLQEMERQLQPILESLAADATEELCSQLLEQVQIRIQRLGAINLAAIDEYKSASERKVYLDAQNEDLETALQTLESAIRKIDRETRTKFKETFDLINQGLQRIFPQVFGGGHAYLEMTGEDLLDTGVAIMARPPGKRNSTIHLLSGGEKALTAISMVFSIFQLNPAPFCMLDEVDAPLDDANVRRFCNIVEEMSSRVQFIYITHNKITMEMASHMMGVTMHEPGVSRLVSVDIEQAAAMAAE